MPDPAQWLFAADLGRVEAGGGLSRFLLEAYGSHPTLYALASVIALLAAGALLGWLTEVALAVLGYGTQNADHVE